MATAAGYRMPIFEPDPVFVPLPALLSLQALQLVPARRCCPVYLPDVLRNAISNSRPCLFRRLALQTSMRASCLLFWRAACFA